MSYQKHVWVTQEIIRGKNLNHIEDGIFNEEHRSINREDAIEESLNTERTRAINAESELSNRVTTNTNNISEHVANTSNPHSVTKSQVGLGSVPNVTTNNQTPTFTQAETRANIASGEKLSVIFGKLMKWFADLKTVAFSGSYTDLSNLPTIPTVNNATLTIQKNGTTVKTFTANASSNVTANITVPTKTSDITNDSGFITDAGVTGVKGNSESTYRTGQVNITKANIGLGSVGNYKAVSTVANQGLTEDEKAAARANIGAGSASGTGTVTSVTAGAGLSGGTISVSGTIKANLKSETQSTLTAATKGTTSSREYAVGLDANGNLSVNVPWTGTVTKVSTGAGLTGGDVTTTGTIKADLKSETKSSLTAASKGTTSSREYAVGLDSAGDLSVNIPWTDTRDFKMGTTASGASNNTLIFVYTT